MQLPKTPDPDLAVAGVSSKPQVDSENKSLETSLVEPLEALTAEVAADAAASGASASEEVPAPAKAPGSGANASEEAPAPAKAAGSGKGPTVAASTAEPAKTDAKRRKRNPS